MVDSDPDTLWLIAVNLEARGYEALTFSSSAMALAQLEHSTPDLIILDIVIPGIDGLELIRRVRQVSKVPMMIVSAKADMSTKLEALEAGADDYLTKPFGVEELLGRIGAILRRSVGSEAGRVEGSYHCGELNIDLDRSEVILSGEQVKLSAQEWAVLRALIRSAGRVVTGRALLQQAWGPEYGDEGDYVRAYVARLRKKLEPEPHRPRYILTERGLGYRLVHSHAIVQPGGEMEEA